MKFYALALCALLFCGCDDGKIPEVTGSGHDSGVSTRLSGNVSGTASYAGTNFSVVMAAFGTSDYALKSKPLAEPSDGLSLPVDPELTASVEICVITPLRDRVVSFAAVAPGEVIHADGLDVSLHAAASSVVASACFQCHGGTSHSAAGLNLSELDALRGVPSTKIDSCERVSSSGHARSALWQAVATNVSLSWSYDHTPLLTPEKAAILAAWIDL